jgi:hypothetical protein
MYGEQHMTTAKAVVNFTRKRIGDKTLVEAREGNGLTKGKYASKLVASIAEDNAWTNAVSEALTSGFSWEEAIEFASV